MTSHDNQMRQYNNFKICKQILRSSENRIVWANLKTDLNNNLYYNHFFDISLNTISFKRTTKPYKMLRDIFYLLEQFPLTASETEVDYHHYKLNVRITSRVVEQFKGLVNEKNLKLSAHMAQCLVSIGEIKIWQYLQKIQ